MMPPPQLARILLCDAQYHFFDKELPMSIFVLPVRTAVAAIALGAAGLASPAIAQSGPFHDLSAIDNAVAQFAGAAIGQAGGAQAPVDRQMRLSACNRPLALEYFGSDNTAIRVTCPQGWRIFVPLMQVRRDAVEVQAPAITRRDVLRVEAGGAGFRVARQGEALEDGRIGQSIRVKLDDGSRRGRIVTAQVIESGRVLVPIR